MIKGSDIRDARGRRSLSQQQLADAVGVSRKAVTTWEAGGVIRRTHLVRVAEVLGLAVDENADEHVTVVDWSEATDLELIAELNRRAAKRASEEIARYKGDTSNDVTQPAPVAIEGAQGQLGNEAHGDDHSEVVGSLARRGTVQRVEGDPRKRSPRSAG